MSLRILYDNKADSADSLVASTTAGSLAAANLLTDIKSEVWRSTGTSASLTLVWTDPVACNAAILPFSNLTAGATLRARGYTQAADSVAAVDSGAVAACGVQPLGHFHWGAHPLGVNAYTYPGVGSYGRVYFPATPIRKLVLDIADTGNAAGYLQAGRVVTGLTWSPEFDASSGAELQVGDDSKNERSDAGDLRTEPGTTFRTVRLSMEFLQDADRVRLYEILRGNGMSRAVFISLFPQHVDVAREQQHQVYGKLARGGSMGWTYFNAASAPLEIEEV